jgi:hypothetical protein
VIPPKRSKTEEKEFFNRIGRLPLFAITGVEVPVLRNKQLLNNGKFRLFDPLEAANCGPNGSPLMMIQLAFSVTPIRLDGNNSGQEANPCHY